MTPPDGLTIRAREPEDAAGLAALFNLPRFRWGTARRPFESVAPAAPAPGVQGALRPSAR